MDTSLHYAAFVFGLVGGLHCLGMCGPIVTAYSLPLAVGKKRSNPVAALLLPHLLYNLGRTTTYALLGAVAGAVGNGVFSASRIIGAERIGFTLFGLAMVVFAVHSIRKTQSSNGSPFGFISRSAVFKKTVGAAIISSNPASKYPLGLMLGLLPCHLIYAMLMQAGATGSVRQGALLLGFFGLGTIPALLGTGLASQLFGRSFRTWGDRLVTASVLVLGILFLARGIGYDVLTFGHGNGHTSCH